MVIFKYIILAEKKREDKKYKTYIDMFFNKRCLVLFILSIFYLYFSVRISCLDFITSVKKRLRLFTRDVVIKGEI